MTTQAPSYDAVRDALEKVMDPELGRSLVQLGLVRALELDGADVHVELQLTSPACPYADQIIQSIKNAVANVDGVSGVEVELVWPGR